jgi:hypothetical protein
MNFSGGKNVSLAGSAPGEQVSAVLDFSDTLRKFMLRGQPLFNNRSDPPRITTMPGGVVRWSYDLELKRSGE